MYADCDDGHNFWYETAAADYVIDDYYDVAENMFVRDIERNCKRAGMSLGELADAVELTTDELLEIIDGKPTLDENVLENVIFDIKWTLWRALKKRI